MSQKWRGIGFLILAASIAAALSFWLYYSQMLSPIKPPQIEEPIEPSPIGIAEAIINYQSRLSTRSLDGVIVAQVVSLASKSTIQIWQYRNSKLVKVNKEVLNKALYGDQKEDWPPFIFLFTLKSSETEQALVDVLTLYDMGIAEDGQSRGGNAAIWELKRKDEQWKVVSMDEYEWWD